MSEIKPCPFCGANPHQGLGKVQHCSLRGDPFQRFHIKCPKGHAEISAPNRERAVEGWNARPIEDDLTASLNRTSDACASVQKERDELREMLGEAMPLFREMLIEIGVVIKIMRWGKNRDDLIALERRASTFLARYEGGR